MEPVHTNIVQVTPNPEEESPTVVSEESPEVDKDVYRRKLAIDAIQFLEEEFKEDTSDEFWKIVRDECDKRITSPAGEVVTAKPMLEKDVRSFADQTIPWGKYQGQKIGTVLKRDRAALDRLAIQPLLVQIRLQKFLASPFDKMLGMDKTKKPKGKR